MYKYEIIIYWSEEDGLYITEVPELPGCMADGKTYEEALKNTQKNNRRVDRNCKRTWQRDTET
jgi:hypothetical protein